MNFTIEITASKPLLDALTQIAAALQGQRSFTPVEPVEPAAIAASIAEAVTAPAAEPEQAPAKTRRRTNKATEQPAAEATEVPETAEQAPAPVVQNTGEKITIEAVRAAVREFTTTPEKREQARALLIEIGAASVTNLDESKYAEFLEKLNALCPENTPS
ncbi:MAG: hypothetical protein AAGU19_07855 [Prolixibacteraceae bacterium]